MDWGIIVNHSVMAGAIMSGALTVLIIVSLLVNKEMWLQDYPPDVKEAWGPMSEKAKRQRAVFATLFFAAIIGFIAWATIRLGAVLSGPLPFVAVFASSVIMFAMFNITDAVIIDWLILTVLWPGLGVLPGTEGMAGYRDFRFWTVNFAKGFVASALVGLLTAGIAAGIALVGTLL